MWLPARALQTDARKLTRFAAASVHHCLVYASIHMRTRCGGVAVLQLDRQSMHRLLWIVGFVDSSLSIHLHGHLENQRSAAVIAAYTLQEPAAVHTLKARRRRRCYTRLLDSNKPTNVYVRLGRSGFTTCLPVALYSARQWPSIYAHLSPYNEARRKWHGVNQHQLLLSECWSYDVAKRGLQSMVLSYIFIWEVYCLVASTNWCFSRLTVNLEEALFIIYLKFHPALFYNQWFIVQFLQLVCSRIRYRIQVGRKVNSKVQW